MGYMDSTPHPLPGALVNVPPRMRWPHPIVWVLAALSWYALYMTVQTLKF